MSYPYNQTAQIKKKSSTCYFSSAPGSSHHQATPLQQLSLAISPLPCKRLGNTFTEVIYIYQCWLGKKTYGGRKTQRNSSSTWLSMEQWNPRPTNLINNRVLCAYYHSSFVLANLICSCLSPKYFLRQWLFVRAFFY